MGMLRLHYTLYGPFDKKQLPYALYVAFCTLIHCCDFNHALYRSRIWKSLHYAHYTLYADYAFQTDPINSMFVYFSHFQRRKGLLFLNFSSALFNRQQQIQVQESISTVKPRNLCPCNLRTPLLCSQHCVIHHSVPFTTYNNTCNLRISQSAVQFCLVPKSADCGVLLYNITRKYSSLKSPRILILT